MNNSFQMKIRQGLKFLPYLVCLAFLFAMPVIALAATTVGEAVSVGTTLAVGGATTLDGHVTVGNATTTDIMYINSRVASSIIPTANKSIDLGEFSRAYKNIYVSSTAYLATVSTTQIAPWANNTSDFGNYAFAWKNVFVSGTAYLAIANLTGAATLESTLAVTNAATFNGHITLGNVTTTDIMYLNSRVASSIIPTANNSIDLGEYDRAYKDVFASGTAYSASSTVFNPSTTSSVYIKSGTGNLGGQLILKAFNGNCYAVYIGRFNEAGTLGVTTTAVTCY